LGGNLQVHKVLYKPTVMPYFTFRFAGLITTFAFFAYSNWKVSVNQAYAGYYNAMGDFHLSQDSVSLAEGYYQRSVFLATRNYHAHYGLAQFLGARGEYEKEKQEYTRLVDGRPLDLAYLNLSQLDASDNSFPSSALVLKHGLAASAVLVLLAFAISDMRNAALAYLGLNPAKPAVEFEIRLPKAALTTAADTQVELLTDRNQKLAKVQEALA